MRHVRFVFAAGFLAFSLSVFAGEFNDQCAWGLANEKHVKTDCSINMIDTDGKIYCFSNGGAKESFMKDPIENTKKAKETFGRR